MAHFTHNFTSANLNVASVKVQLYCPGSRWWSLDIGKFGPDSSASWRHGVWTCNTGTSSPHRALRHAGGTSTRPPSSGRRCLCSEGERTASVPSTPTTRSTATRSKCSIRRPTAGWARWPHSRCQRDGGVIQPVRHTHTINTPNKCMTCQAILNACIVFRSTRILNYFHSVLSIMIQPRMSLEVSCHIVA